MKYRQWIPTVQNVYYGWYCFRSKSFDFDPAEVLAWMKERPNYVHYFHALGDDPHVYVIQQRYFFTPCEKLAFEFKMRWC